MGDTTTTGPASTLGTTVDTATLTMEVMAGTGVATAMVGTDAMVSTVDSVAASDIPSLAGTVLSNRLNTGRLHTNSLRPLTKRSLRMIRLDTNSRPSMFRLHTNSSLSTVRRPTLLRLTPLTKPIQRLQTKLMPALGPVILTNPLKLILQLRTPANRSTTNRFGNP